MKRTMGISVKFVQESCDFLQKYFRGRLSTTNKQMTPNKLKVLIHRRMMNLISLTHKTIATMKEPSKSSNKGQGTNVQ
jgi:hypothetical protein